MSVFEGFSGVANWVPFRNVGRSTHGLISSESACGPGFISSEWCAIEKSNINLGVSLVVPSEGSKFCELNNISVTINWVNILI